jgi:hypothetical protein
MAEGGWRKAEGYHGPAAWLRSLDVKPYRQGRQAAKEQKSLTAKDTKHVKEQKSFTAKDAKDAKETIIRTKP